MGELIALRSLPQAANGRFEATILIPPTSGHGRNYSFIRRTHGSIGIGPFAPSLEPPPMLVGLSAQRLPPSPTIRARSAGRGSNRSRRHRGRCRRSRTQPPYRSRHPAPFPLAPRFDSQLEARAGRGMGANSKRDHLSPTLAAIAPGSKGRRRRRRMKLATGPTRSPTESARRKRLRPPIVPEQPAWIDRESDAPFHHPPKDESATPGRACRHGQSLRAP
jgi:hypothetical protein